MRSKRPILLPLALLYGVVVRLRNWFYDKGVLKIEHVEVPVISIGNMTAGGTGKTPFVEYLARYFSAKGILTAIISRGYRRSSEGTQIISDGRTVFGTSASSGDEPYQMARKLPGMIVIVDEDRVRGARCAIRRYHPDLILLDDGFQHRRLHRDIDIVLIDATIDLPRISFLPAGMRREPLASLRRASLLALTRVDATLPTWSGSLNKFSSAPVIGVRFDPVRNFLVGSTTTNRNDGLGGRRCLAFCGIGNPMSFRRILEGMGLDVADFVSYSDHHRYSIEDFKYLKERFETTRAEIIITTEKDASRMSSSELPEFFPSHACYAVEIAATLTQGEETLHAIHDSVIRKAA